MRTLLAAAAALVLVQSIPAGAQPAPPRQERVAFAKGASSATIKGQLKGDADVDYVVGAAAGQTISVALKVSNRSNYFNVLPPGSENVAMYAGQTGEGYTGMLPTDGDYKVRVYLMRSAARRNETASYTLTVGITGSAAVAPTLGAAPAGDAKVKGTPYHATGQVPCAMGNAPQGSAQCDFGVIRGKAGNAEVHVTPPGGFKRVLTFVAGKVTADSGASVKATKNGDLWSVDINDYEHYRIPDAVISGG